MRLHFMTGCHSKIDTVSRRGFDGSIERHNADLSSVLLLVRRRVSHRDVIPRDILRIVYARENGIGQTLINIMIPSDF